MSEREQKVVVVDDDAGMNQAIERLLKAAGFQTVTFPSAEALLQAGAVANAACLILDIQLPGLSGFELRQRLVEQGTDLPVIFITAFDDPDAQVIAEDAGAIAYFTKPFAGQSLVAAISKMLKLT
jgi:FixJ family two-component response regulator